MDPDWYCKVETAGRVFICLCVDVILRGVQLVVVKLVKASQYVSSSAFLETVPLQGP